MKQVNTALLKSIHNSFQLISRELSRPKEDVVGIFVCGSTKAAIEKVLTLYLDCRGLKNPVADNMNELMNLCIKKNKKLQRFDVSALSCKCEPTQNFPRSYCLGDEKINSCYKLFVELKDFVFEELEINETRLPE